jgi:hypothetical protein
MGHGFLIAAFTATWVIQLGYLLWTAIVWLRQRKAL